MARETTGTQKPGYDETIRQHRAKVRLSELLHQFVDACDYGKSDADLVSSVLERFVVDQNLKSMPGEGLE